jgi:cell pole-organizing protein PopZ
MAEQTAEQEPTMEEILASIRRIISEDDEPAPQEAAKAAAPSPPPKEEPKAKAKPKPAPAPPPKPAPEPEPEPEPEEVLELTQRVDPPRRAAPKPPVEDDIAFEEPTAFGEPEDTLVSEPVANAAASAFGQLVGQMLVSSRSTEGKTLEDIVRELIKPMLREWLDANLRSIVEARVADEVEKIAMRGRR